MKDPNRFWHKPRHMLEGVIDENWLRNLELHIARLATHLGLKNDVLNFTSESLDEIYSTIEREWLDKPLQMQIDFLFSPLLAYCGELVRRQVDGQWDMVMDRVTGTIEPWVVDRLNRRYDIKEVVRPFFDDLRESSMSDTIEYMIRVPKTR